MASDLRRQMEAQYFKAVCAFNSAVRMLL